MVFSRSDNVKIVPLDCIILFHVGRMLYANKPQASVIKFSLICVSKSKKTGHELWATYREVLLDIWTILYSKHNGITRSFERKKKFQWYITHTVGLFKDNKRLMRHNQQTGLELQNNWNSKGWVWKKIAIN